MAQLMGSSQRCHVVVEGGEGGEGGGGGGWWWLVDSNYPKDRVVGPLPNGHSWQIIGGDPNHFQVLG